MATRRQLVVGLAALLAAGLGGFAEAFAQPHPGPARRHRRRVRRHVRRRLRRRAVWRVVHGRRRLVVPVALAVGWELALPDRVVVVKEIHKTQVDGSEVETASVENPDGTTEQVEIEREDTAETKTVLQGSVLPEGDTTTPFVETEEKIEPEDKTGAAGKE